MAQRLKKNLLQEATFRAIAVAVAIVLITVGGIALWHHRWVNVSFKGESTVASPFSTPYVDEHSPVSTLCTIGGHKSIEELERQREELDTLICSPAAQNKPAKFQ